METTTRARRGSQGAEARPEGADERALLQVSHRLPVVLRRGVSSVEFVASSGGLATALSSTHRPGRDRWFGWVGETQHLSATERALLERELEDRGLAAVELPAEERHGYYEGFSNGVLWPLFHYLVDKVHLDAGRAWEDYRRVNARFARAVAEAAPRGALVWVHDYQLLLVPALLRSLRPDLRSGFFLHVPFPSHEVFRVLPWRRELLRGALGADLVGFHTESYRHHFAVTAAHLLGTELSHDAVEFEGRRTALGTFPLGVDVGRWDLQAQTPATAERVRQLRQSAGGRALVLGVDRLDYTKGLPRRLLAIEWLLAHRPALRERVRFVQVAVPTRDGVEDYARYRRTVDQAVGRLNGAYGKADGVPVHLLHQSVDFAELVALYAAADVLLVTPLRDGMNLVAKEFCACQRGGSGVLVLSEFAGAADELSDALVVNPYDVAVVAGALERALEMPLAERRARSERLFAHVNARGATPWAVEFTARLERCPVAPPAELRAPPALERIRDPLLLLDYDGTLVPFAPRPRDATPDAALLALLAGLARRFPGRVHLVSGRPRGWLEEHFGGLPLGLHGEHGACWRGTDGEWLDDSPRETAWKEPALSLFRELVGGVLGGELEEKQHSLAWHYRRVLPELAAELLGALRSRLRRFAREYGVEVLEGAMVLELRARGSHKGAVLPRLLAGAQQELTVVAVGDDDTDEDLFRAAPAGSVTVKVGPKASCAAYYLEGSQDVRAWLGASLAHGSAA